MKKLILLCAITLLISTLTLFPGCGCEQEQEPVKEPEEKENINVLDPDFKGPDRPPFSEGPALPPPS